MLTSEREVTKVGPRFKITGPGFIDANAVQ